MTVNLSCPIYDVAALLPHSGHMVLLDCVTEYGPQHVCASASVGEKHILLVDGVLPATAALEIMAQGIGAFAGIRALEAGEPVRLGFLLGTRKLELFADSLPVGAQILVTAKMSIQDAGGMGVFDCELRRTDPPAGSMPEGGLVARASLNVYSPKDGKVV